jgi:hypothetical protein
VAARSIRVVATAIEALTRLHAAGCAIDASVAFFVPLPPQQPFLAVNHVVRWLCISGGVSLAAMGAGACAFFEERTRQLRRNEKGAARRAYDQRARVHREWLVAHGCGCGGALHAVAFGTQAAQQEISDAGVVFNKQDVHAAVVSGLPACVRASASVSA